MKKLLLLLLALILVTPLFAAGRQEGGAATTGVATATGPLEAYDPPITIETWRSSDNRTYPEGQSLEDNIWTRTMSEELGINFEYQWIAPTGEFNSRVNTTIAAGDLPDMMNNLNLEQYYNLARVNRLAQMSDLVEQYDVGAVRTYLDYGPGITRDMLTINGEIYGWGRGPNLANVQIFTARSDWLDNLGLTMPETLPEIIDLLYAFSEDDPDGNGVDDTYGLGASAGFLRGGMPLEQFFSLHESYPDLWIEEGGELVYGATTEETRDAIEALAQLQADGVLSPEWPVFGTWSEAPDEIAQGNVGAAFAQQWWHNWGGPTQTVSANPGMIWEHVFPKRADGEYVNVPVTAQVTDINAMNSDFANPEALVKLYNLHYKYSIDPETALVEYHTLRVSDDESYSTFFYWNDFFAPYTIDTNPVLSLQVIDAIEGRLPPEDLHPEARGYFEGSMAYLAAPETVSGNDSGYGNYRSFGPGGTNSLAWVMINGNHFKIDAFQGSPTPAQATYAGDLRSTRDELFIQMIVGELDIDEGWDQWLNYFANNGGDDWTEEVNAWYDENR